MSLSGQPAAWQPLRTLALALTGAVMSTLIGGWPVAAVARQTLESMATVSVHRLPFDAQSTYRLIVRGGPFPYSKDGAIFINRERALPVEARGFYREYTVRTPGADDRGARRIVCGWRKPSKPETCFYTRDHYTSFQRILP